MPLSNETPLGIFQTYNPETKQTEVFFSYAESGDIEYFEIQYWSEKERKWKPYDGRNGVVFPTEPHEAPKKSTQVSSSSDYARLSREIEDIKKEIADLKSDSNE